VIFIKPTTAPNTCENILHESNIFPIAGVDEAGRGPLAGPVVACALILPPGLVINGVTDSKKLSEKKRDHLAAEIKAAAVTYAYGIIDAATIDNVNIHQAVLLAMKMAVMGLNFQPKAVLVDGKFAPNIPFPTMYIIKGDSQCHIIAAASILAKVERDKIMYEMHEKYPQYGFSKHKGYGTIAHIEAIKKFGLSPHHRASYKIKGWD